MQNDPHAWFTWRFTLRRLLICMLFLGVILGLNTRQIGPMGMHVPVVYYGWPLPFSRTLDTDAIRSIDAQVQRLASDGITIDRWGAASQLANAYLWQDAMDYSIPFTHQAYRVLKLPECFDPDAAPDCRSLFIVCGTIDVLLALAMLFLVLFLKIPRLRPKPEA